MSWSTALKPGIACVQQEFTVLTKGTALFRAYCPDTVWAALQTRDYATVSLKMLAAFHGVSDDVQAGVAARVARMRLIGRDNRVHHVLLGEQALYSRVGNAMVMRDQLKRLHAATKLEGLKLGIIPVAAPLALYRGGGFELYDRRRVEVEGYGGRLTVDSEDQVAVFEKAFMLLQPSALYGDDARSLITYALASTPEEFPPL